MLVVVVVVVLVLLLLLLVVRINSAKFCCFVALLARRIENFTGKILICFIVDFGPSFKAWTGYLLCACNTIRA